MSAYSPVLWTTRATTILGESIVLVVTLVKIRAWKMTSIGLTRRRTIAVVLFTDGMLAVPYP